MREQANIAINVADVILFMTDVKQGVTGVIYKIEKGNLYLYEKMGYKQTGKTEVINERLTLVFYRKN